MGFDHFNDLQTTTDLPDGFSVDGASDSLSRLTILDILHNMKSAMIGFVEEWITYIIYASALEKFIMASIVMSLYLCVYIIVFVLLRSDIHPNCVTRRRRNFFDIMEEEDASDNHESWCRPRRFTTEELKQYNGKNDMPILVALKGKVYDVSSAFAYYGPSGSYASLAGREASRAVARLNFDEKELCNYSLDDLTSRERQTLEKWVKKFRSRNYPIVGTMLINDSKKMKKAVDDYGYAYENKDKTL